MAFVYRKQNNQHPSRAKTPGPGQYNIQEQSSCAPAPGYFGRSPRQVWQASTTPGPGQYNLGSPNCEGQKIVYQSKDDNFCVTSDFFNPGQSCSSNFKSKSRRLTNNENITPGPGQYDLTDSRSKSPKQVYHNNKPTKLTKYLYKQIKNKEGHTGGLESCEFNAYGTGQFGERTNKQSPGNQAGKSGHNYKSIFNSRVERQPLSRPQTSTGIGPGSYNLAESFNAIDRKTQATLVKNTQQSATLQVSSHGGKKHEIGPGYYQINASSFQRPKSSYNRGIACFGSTQTRFTNVYSQKAVKVGAPGPQSYFQSSRVVNPVSKTEQVDKKAAFNSSSAQAHELPVKTCSTYFTEVSPFSYHPKNDFNELLKKNYIKGSIGNFGSNAERFKDVTKEEDTREETSCTLAIAYRDVEAEDRKKPRPNTSQLKTSLSLRSTQGLQKFVHVQDQAPLCYDTSFGTIGNKYSQKKQKDAPFLVGSQRFSNLELDSEKEPFGFLRKQSEQNLHLVRNNEKPRKTKFKKGKMRSMNNIVMGKFMETATKMGQIQNMFNQIKNQPAAPLGPQTYNPNPIPKRKTHNVLFRS